ncbi:MAG: LacI family DNA-binding transcriptional regulator [Armatimonadetes bacterium]|nr:LacI family DNA-binding transcriptional regulator [Armatimonadota bacterium]
MRVTQADIAKIANVSQATVSRVLAGDDHVEPILRDRVLRIMREKNYRPDVRARSLRLQQTNLIGLVLKRPRGALVDDPFFAALTSGIVDALAAKPYHLCLDYVTDQASQEHVYDEMLRSRRVDGLILVEPTARDERVELLQRDKFPFVIIGNPHNDEIASIDNDNVVAGRIGTEHLISRGYRKIVFLAGPEGFVFSDDRVDGYVQAMVDAGLQPRVVHCAFGLEAARDASLALFDGPDCPDAMLVLDDFMAYGTYMAARSRYMEVPDELGIVGFNDSLLCRMAEGGLTSVSLNLDLMVRRAVAKLLDIIESGQVTTPAREIVPCAISVRGSSSSARGVVQK